MKSREKQAVKWSMSQANSWAKASSPTTRASLAYQPATLDIIVCTHKYVLTRTHPYDVYIQNILTLKTCTHKQTHTLQVAC